MRVRGWTLALVAATVTACSEQPVAPTNPVDVGGAPELSIADAPPLAGIVTRGETFLAVGWTDEREGTFVMIGFDPVDFCTGPVDFDYIPAQDVVLRNGRGVLHHLQGTGLTTSVWPFPGFNCGLVTSTEPLATGLSDLVSTDNDLNGDGRSNANAFGFRAHGTLTLVNGSDAAFSAHVNYVINGNQGFLANSQISLQE
jgi:hypothetical protein